MKMCKPTIKNLLDPVIFKLRSSDNLWNFCVNAHVVAFKMSFIVYLESIYQSFFSFLAAIIIT